LDISFWAMSGKILQDATYIVGQIVKKLKPEPIPPNVARVQLKN